MGKILETTSTAFLEGLVARGQLFHLKKITRNEDDICVYHFAETNNVRRIYDEINEYYKHNIDEFAITEAQAAALHTIVKLCDEGTISTRNKKVVRKLFEAGYSACLVKISYDERAKKHVYYFMSCPEIRLIKDREDCAARERYEKRKDNEELCAEVAHLKSVLQKIEMKIN